MSAANEPATIWRAALPQVHEGKYWSVIEDRGVMSKAVPDSRNNYVFSETGVGTRPLVIVGTSVQIMAGLAKWRMRSVVSNINGLPTIYAGLTPYVPGGRFRALTPFNDLFQQFVENMIDIFIDHDAAEYASLIDKALDLALKGVKKPAKREKPSPVYEFKISYFPEAGMHAVGQCSVSLRDLAEAMQRQYKSSYGALGRRNLGSQESGRLLV